MTPRPDTIADVPDALTPAWLTSALASAGHLGGAAVVAVDVRPLGTGQMCDSVRVSLRYDRETGAPATLVAKLPAADETSRTTAVAMGSYEKEVRFYQELAPGLDVRTPRPYYADLEPGTPRFVLLLEDLAPAVQGDQLAGCSPAAAEVAVDELVRLHAPRWGDASLAELSWLTGDVDAGRAMALMLLPTLWEGFQERYAAHLTDEVRTAGEQLFAHLGAYLDGGPGPRTVVHGDFRLDNLLFHPSGSSVAVVDWQTCALGAGAGDVAYFIGAGLLAEHRRDAEQRLVRRYLDGLVEAGVRDYGWDQLWDDYRRGTWTGLMMAVGASMMVERTERGDQMFLAMATRHAVHALELDAVETLAG